MIRSIIRRTRFKIWEQKTVGVWVKHICQCEILPNKLLLNLSSAWKKLWDCGNYDYRKTSKKLALFRREGKTTSQCLTDFKSVAMSAVRYEQRDSEICLAQCRAYLFGVSKTKYKNTIEHRETPWGNTSKILPPCAKAQHNIEKRNIINDIHRWNIQRT